MFCISAKLAIAWAMDGAEFDVIRCFRNSLLVRVRSSHNACHEKY
jgi:hypothetical protein